MHLPPSTCDEHGQCHWAQPPVGLDTGLAVWLQVLEFDRSYWIINSKVNIVQALSRIIVAIATQGSNAVLHHYISKHTGEPGHLFMAQLGPCSGHCLIQCPVK
jgi:hypothetical protein